MCHATALGVADNALRVDTRGYSKEDPLCDETERGGLIVAPFPATRRRGNQ